MIAFLQITMDSFCINGPIIDNGCSAVTYSAKYMIQRLCIHNMQLPGAPAPNLEPRCCVFLLVLLAISRLPSSFPLF